MADAKTIAMYVSVKNEPDTYLALDTLSELGVRILLPKLGPGLNRMWAAVRVRRPGERSSRSPPSPKGDPLSAEVIEEADVIIVPALAVNQSGTRLGQGGGWYDRMLKQNVTDKVGALDLPMGVCVKPSPL